VVAPISTKLYAPQARLVDLASGTVLGATTVTVTGTTPSGSRDVAVVSPDIVSARVTLTSTGIGQLQVTLNNQRFVAGLPVFPPWKYNDFSRARPTLQASDGLGGITFGQRLRLDLRYGDGDWTKMIVAQVTDLQFSFPASGGAQVQIVGEDLLSLLKVKPTADKNYERKHEEDIASEVWNAVFTVAEQRPELTIISGAREREGRTEPLRSLRHTKSTTYFQFLQDMAERLDYEMHVEFKDRNAAAGTTVGQAASAEITAQSELQFFFEPARSGNPPVATEQDLLGQADDTFHYVLRWGHSLIEFTPKLKVFDMPTSAEALGTNPGRRARSAQRLTQSEIDGLFTRELPVSPNYSNLTMTTALAARTAYFGAVGVSNENNDSSQGSNLDEARLKRKAMASFLKRVREFLTADGSVIGLPRLRPGVYVDIVGIRPPFDGYYYVTKTVHSLDSSGYKTQFSLRRPGMLPPEKYLDLPAAATPPPPPEATP
jgi:hypothetical protein